MLRTSTRPLPAAAPRAARVAAACARPSHARPALARRRLAATPDGREPPGDDPSPTLSSHQQQRQQQPAGDHGRVEWLAKLGSVALGYLSVVERPWLALSTTQMGGWLPQEAHRALPLSLWTQLTLSAFATIGKFVLLAFALVAGLSTLASLALEAGPTAAALAKRAAVALGMLAAVPA